jgi:hypothetical protein
VIAFMLPVSLVGSAFGAYLSLGLVVAVLLMSALPERKRLLSGATVAVLGMVTLSIIIRCGVWIPCF